jgi:serine protease Do
MAVKPRKSTLAGIALWSSAIVAGYFGYNYALDQRFAFAEQSREEVRQGLASAADLSSAFRSVGKVVEPSVVSIQVRKKSGPSVRGQFDEDMLRRFFPDRDGDGEPDLPRGFDPEDMPEQMGTGSGVIMETDGNKAYVVTNNHVAGGAEEMVITLHDGREIKNGKLLGADPKTDLAVVVIEAERLSTAKWGNSDELQKGDWIMAFGSPFGYVGSMTHGIVSALNRQAGILGAGGYESFIQVDAPINPGNSGGPLVNLKGEVVGINTAIASRSGGFQGIGFTIPSNQAKLIYSQLKDKGKVIRGWLGVGIRDVAKEPGLAKSFGYEGTTGVIVDQVIAGTPAENKLQNGDIVTSINDKKVESVQQLRNTIAQIAPNTEVKMHLHRRGQEQDVTIKLGEQPEDVLAVRPNNNRERGERSTEAPAATEAIGLTVQTLSAEMAEKQGLRVQSGAVVTKVERNSPAFREGLRVGDVITEVGDTKVADAAAFVAAAKKADLNKGVRLYVTTREGSRFVFVQAEK